MKSLTLDKFTINKPEEWDEGVKVEINDYDYDSTTIPFEDLVALRNFIDQIIKDKGLDKPTKKTKDCSHPNGFQAWSTQADCYVCGSCGELPPHKRQ